MVNMSPAPPGGFLHPEASHESRSDPKGAESEEGVPPMERPGADGDQRASRRGVLRHGVFHRERPRRDAGIPQKRSPAPPSGGRVGRGANFLSRPEAPALFHRRK